MALNPSPEPRYVDFYGMLSYSDFLALRDAGSLTKYSISKVTDIKHKP
jgi:hypothetical protein